MLVFGNSRLRSVSIGVGWRGDLLALMYSITASVAPCDPKHDNFIALCTLEGGGEGGSFRRASSMPGTSTHPSFPPFAPPCSSSQLCCIPKACELLLSVYLAFLCTHLPTLPFALHHLRHTALFHVSILLKAVKDRHSWSLFLGL